MKCDYPECTAPATQLAKLRVRPIKGHGYAALILGFITCADHLPTPEGIGPNIREALARTLGDEPDWSTAKVEGVPIGSPEGQSYFKMRGN